MKKAIVRSEINSTNKKTGKTTAHRAEVTEKKTRKLREGEYVAVIKVSTGVRIATGYQSAGLEVGVELPWPVHLKDLDEVKKGFEQAYDLIGEEMRTQSANLESVVEELAEKYRH